MWTSSNWARQNMKCGSRTCIVMLNYKLISVSATTLYVFIRFHVESFNAVMEKSVCVNMSHGWRMRGVRLSPRTGNKVFSRPSPYFSVYEVLLYKCLFVNWGIGLNFIFFCTINAAYKQYKTYHICRWSKVQKGIQKKVKLTFGIEAWGNAVSPIGSNRSPAKAG